MQNIRFFTEDIQFELKQKNKLRKWIESVLVQNKKKAESINYIFTSDQYLLDINKQYLNHNYFTDIITFNNASAQESLQADIFISVERVKDNAKSLKTPFTDELHRVMIHGILHLIGFDDKTDQGKTEMRKKENHYLALRF
jgi:rRNA maturation RNase YbeY